jgi:hypothetical protein
MNAHQVLVIMFIVDISKYDLRVARYIADVPDVRRRSWMNT